MYHRYGNATSVDERHRHRYEVVLLNCQIAILNRICHCSLYNDEKCFVFQLNPDMVPDFERAGLQFVGKDESGRRMEIIELPSHKFFIGAQFHPEFKSRPGKPSPLFLGLIAAASGQLEPLLQRSCNNLPKTHVNNGKVQIRKLYPTVPVKSPLTSLVNGYYPNGTGIHT